ncbi:MAG: hypothetical protein Q4B60_05140 [Erysipelotrichaceae bacterium]|nr:hypothetical protein [Erysipelotrichaceae bacterium]
MKKIIICLCLLLSFSGCSKKEKEQVTIPDIELKEPFNEEKILNSLIGNWEYDTYKVLSDKSGNSFYSAGLLISDDYKGELTLSGDLDYVYEPELSLRVHEGDLMKEYGNDTWYFSLDGSMSLAGNEFVGTVVEETMILKCDIYQMKDMESDLEKSVVMYLSKYEHTSFQAPIYDAMESMPEELVNDLNNSDLSAYALALIYANPSEEVRSHHIDELDLEDSDEYVLIVPIQKNTHIKVYSGEYDGNNESPVGFTNINEEYFKVLDAGEGLLIKTNIPEGMPSYYIEFENIDGYAYWILSYPGESNPYLLKSE